MSSVDVGGSVDVSVDAAESSVAYAIAMDDSESGDSWVAKWEGVSDVDVEVDSVDGEGSVGVSVVYVDDAVSEDSSMCVAISGNVAANSDAAVNSDCGDASVDSSMSDGVDAAYVSLYSQRR